MKIMETVKKIPGGLMIVPLLLGCLVNTFFPQVFAYFDGTFTYSLWKGGSMSLLAAFLFCNGTTINFKEAGVLPENIKVTDICTCHNTDVLFSHRGHNGKRGNIGAFLSIV